ncbi:uncharacterized protein LOC117289306 isoform X1 [Asterias rubens]|uniref:uncharacterized protein LOC117289306 isoform X1 n=2 Tax=Asterias rubens TaxID=7604 RepID=UPI001455BA00|nr:uncharacterized protein LOC117289306 isoform X1 [Asterias rubens]
MTEYTHWMETLYGWAPASMKPKSMGNYVHSSGFQGLSNIGMVVRDIQSGNIIQLESQATGGLLRVNTLSGKIDFNGVFGKQSQFIVQRFSGDVITLRCVANTKNFLILRNGTLYANGKGDPQCRFLFHLCDGMHMKFEAVHNANRFVSVHRKYGGNDDVRALRTRSAMSSGDRGTQGSFKVILVGHMNQSFAT